VGEFLREHIGGSGKSCLRIYKMTKGINTPSWPENPVVGVPAPLQDQNLCHELMVGHVSTSIVQCIVLGVFILTE